MGESGKFYRDNQNPPTPNSRSAKNNDQSVIKPLIFSVSVLNLKNMNVKSNELYKRTVTRVKRMLVIKENW